jgi:hypothetical protein
LFDNSVKVQLLADIKQGKIIHIIEKLPDWVTKYLGQHFQQNYKQEIKIKDMKDIDEVKKAYKKLKNKL